MIKKYLISTLFLFSLFFAGNFVLAQNQNLNLENLPKKLLNIKVPGAPKGAIFSPDGKEIWVTSLSNKKQGVSVFDSITGKKITSFNLNNYPAVEVVFNKDGTRVYASQMETAKVFEIDAINKKALRSFKTGGNWTKVVELSPDGKKLYASNWISNNVSEIDLGTGKLIRKISTVKTPRGLYITKDGNFLYVAGFDKGQIQKINLITGVKKIIYSGGYAMRHFVVDEDKGVLFVSDMGRNAIYKVNLKDDSVIKFASTESHPNTIALSPDKKILYVSCRGHNFSSTNYYVPGPDWGTVELFDTETGKLLDVIIGGNQPTALAVSPDGKTMVFSDFLDSRLQVYQIPTYEQIKSTNGGRSQTYKSLIKKK
ncbi:MAG: YncE family protein [Candidatus Paceibacterota bacterium]|jgi:YVTN family beta-propeller protein